jgi:hypothetical protein
MSNQFKREERYIVVKLKHLAAQQRAPLVNFLLTNGIPKVDCVVVEDDWPEYEPTWTAIERRMTGQPAVTASEELDAVQHWRGKHAQALRERDALQQLLNERDEQLDSDSAAAALRTLIGMGYSYNSGQLWKPPLGKSPDFNLIDSLRARIAELERYKMSIWPSEETLIAAGLGYPIGKEQAMKIYKAALRSRTDAPENADCEWCYGVGHDYYGEPCCGCCKPDPEALARLIVENAPRTSFVLPADQPSGKFYKSEKLRRGFRDGWSACLHAVKALNEKSSTEVNQ